MPEERPPTVFGLVLDDGGRIGNDLRYGLPDIGVVPAAHVLVPL